LSSSAAFPFCNLIAFVTSCSVEASEEISASGTALVAASSRAGQTSAGG